MKKLQVVVALAVLFIAGSATAQNKIGYIRIDDIVSLMPELSPQKINLDTVGQQYVKDSVLPRANFLQSEIQRKYPLAYDSTQPKAVRDQYVKDIQDHQEELQGADQFIQQVLQAKQQQYLQPYYVKAKNAIDAVAKKKGYAYVLNTDVFLVAPPADDLSEAVLTELKIPIPKQNKPATPPTKPAGN
jgi:outer membrane protein